MQARQFSNQLLGMQPCSTNYAAFTAVVDSPLNPESRPNPNNDLRQNKIKRQQKSRLASAFLIIAYKLLMAQNEINQSSDISIGNFR